MAENVTWQVDLAKNSFVSSHDFTVRSFSSSLWWLAPINHSSGEACYFAVQYVIPPTSLPVPNPPMCVASTGRVGPVTCVQYSTVGRIFIPSNAA